MSDEGLRSGGQIDGDVAIVTGGSGGIGRATCRALASLGARLVVVDLDESGVQAAVAELEAAGAEALGLALDVRSERDMEEMARVTLEHYGRIDILVASAGVLRGTTPRIAADLPVAEWDRVLDTNLKGTFLSNRAVLPAMLRRRRGTILNLSSTSGRQGVAFDAAYSASKFGVIGFSESLAEEVRHQGVRVQAILPGPVDTPLWDQNGPLPRPPNILAPERVAELIALLVGLPEGAVLHNPTIVGFQHSDAPGRRGSANGSSPAHTLGTKES